MGRRLLRLLLCCSCAAWGSLAFQTIGSATKSGTALQAARNTAANRRVLRMGAGDPEKVIAQAKGSALQGLKDTLQVEKKPSWQWPFWFILPIAPYSNRRTVIKEAVPGKIWTFDQMQGVLYVNVPIRMTVVKLKEGLFVYAPVAPTKEVMAKMRELEKEHGPVQHVVLPTLAIEHKVFAGPFARQFRQAQAWAMPGQYAFPFNLPLGWLGFGAKPVKLLPEGVKGAPWEGEMNHAILGPLISNDGIGAFGEAVFFHKDTSTLLVTDIVVKVSEEIPEIVEQGDARALLFHARDDALQKIEDTRANRVRGWKRIQQFGLFFQPSSLEVLPLKESVLDVAPKSPMKELGWGGIFPFAWGEASVENASFQALQGGLFVAPILQTLILNREPERVLAFADVVAKWPIKRLISCHLGYNVPTSGAEFRRAFRFLEKGYQQPTRARRATGSSGGLFGLFGAKQETSADPLEEDLQFLRDAEVQLVKFGTLAPAAPPAEVRKTL
eukprot:TRINITY_DN11027_c0_g1_i1.p1 TRINITY_DN11027_c0_g1~~TRINITY_DN11027_c0_g1_i1.p1  ORF type:complete len:498 (+),score=94.27 TRINITY_DN11027_c0_g1_i1:56-1549(+)